MCLPMSDMFEEYQKPDQVAKVDGADETTAPNQVVEWNETPSIFKPWSLPNEPEAPEGVEDGGKEGITVEILKISRTPLLVGGYRINVIVRDADSGAAFAGGANIHDGDITEENEFTLKVQREIIHQAVGKLIEKRFGMTTNP